MMTTDSIHHAFRSLGISDPQNDPRKQSLQQTQQQQQQQQQQHTPPPRQNTGSLRSPTVMTADLPGQPGYSQGIPSQSPNSMGQSAAARFERFFPSSPNTTASNPSSAGQTFTSSSIGSTAGLAANSAFGSFGHSLAPGSMGGGSISSSHFGSNNPPRKAPSRAAIPSQWSSHDPNSLSPPTSGSPPNTMASLNSYQQQDPGAPNADDDVIPTAIVVKNIPFSVKKEQLLQIIQDLGIPVPYAFNYHMDQGVFRGLAFANFRSAEEADTVVAALNGFDVSGRKLRVEYKKVLQAGEKERIEKEKAIKRMQSMQLEKERERERRRQQDDYAGNAYLMPGYNSSGHFNSPEAYLTDPAGLQQSFDTGLRAPLTADSLRRVPSSQRLGTSAERGPSSSTSNLVASGNGTKKEELDMNDAPTLEIYSKVLLFKDDRMRDELSFSRSLTPLERRTVHLVAQKLGLFHYSMGEGDERYVIVTKNEVNAPARPLRSQSSSIGRSQRLDPSSAGNYLAPGSAATTGRTGLRSKKSAPDMNRLDRDGSVGYTGSNGYLGASGGSLASRRSNSNLREGFSSTSGRRSQNSNAGVGGAAGLQSLFASSYDAPPVPSLPNSNGSEHGLGGTHPNLIRQPRGPPTPGSDVRNFAVRSRVATSTSTTSSSNSTGAPQTNSPPVAPAAGFQLQINGSPTKAYPAASAEEATTHSPLEF